MDLRIKSNISYPEIEDAYRTINNFNTVDLYLPSTLTGKQLGIYAELIQLIITWDRLTTGKIYINYTSDNSDIEVKIDEVFTKYWNFVAGSLGYSKGIYLLDDKNISKTVALTIREQINHLSLQQSWKKGNNSMIFSVQHSINPYPSAFYYGNGNLKSKREFIELTKNIIKEVATNYTRNVSLTRLNHYREKLGEILYELIENTHFWSQSNFENKTFQTGILGVLVSTHSGSKAVLLKNCKDDKPFSSYIDNTLVDNDETNYIIELSIFDSGSGLASKWLNKDYSDFNSDEEIYSAIIDCLIKNNTSDLSSSYTRGFGLHNIMSLLGSQGFLKLRSNGLKLYRDFSTNSFNGFIDNPRENYDLNNWFEAQGGFKPKYRTEGTLFSIFLPLEINTDRDDN